MPSSPPAHNIYHQPLPLRCSHFNRIPRMEAEVRTGVKPYESVEVEGAFGPFGGHMGRQGGAAGVGRGTIPGERIHRRSTQTDGRGVVVIEEKLEIHVSKDWGHNMAYYCVRYTSFSILAGVTAILTLTSDRMHANLVRPRWNRRL